MIFFYNGFSVEFLGALVEVVEGIDLSLWLDLLVI